MTSLEIQKAVDRSNIGVIQLKDGDFQAAISNFSAAFNLVKSGSDFPSDQSAASTIGSRTRVIDGTISRFIFLCEEDEWKFGKQNNIIYCNGIAMPPKFLPENDESALSGLQLLLTSIIVFNLAVAHHRYAMECNEKDSAKMKHGLALAVRLYESSYKLIRAMGKKKCPSFLALTMAILNNLGKVYESAHNESQANKYFTQLTSTLLFLMDRQDDMQSQFKGLISKFLNAICHLIFNEKDAAAAAA